MNVHNPAPKKVIALDPETRPQHYTFGARRFDRESALEELQLLLDGKDLGDGETYETAMDARREALACQRRLKRVIDDDIDIAPGTRIYRDATGFTWRVVAIPLGRFD